MKASALVSFCVRGNQIANSTKTKTLITSTIFGLAVTVIKKRRGEAMLAFMLLLPPVRPYRVAQPAVV